MMIDCCPQKMEYNYRAIGARDELRLCILRALEVNQIKPAPTRGGFGVSLGGVDYALRAPIGSRFVKAGNCARSDKKAPYVDTFTPSGLCEKSALAAAFLSRKLGE